jgi:hypothetical protein
MIPLLSAIHSDARFSVPATASRYNTPSSLALCDVKQSVNPMRRWPHFALKSLAKSQRHRAPR